MKALTEILLVMYQLIPLNVYERQAVNIFTDSQSCSKMIVPYQVMLVKAFPSNKASLGTLFTLILVSFGFLFDPCIHEHNLTQLLD